MKIKFTRSVLKHDGKPSQVNEIADLEDKDARFFIIINSAVEYTDAKQSPEVPISTTEQAISNGKQRDLEAVKTSKNIFKNLNKNRGGK